MMSPRVTAMAASRLSILRPTSTFLTNTTISRSFAIRTRLEPNLEPIPPNHTIDSVKPPKSYVMHNPEADVVDPMVYVRKQPVSAHAIDTACDPPKLSTLDAATLTPGKEGESGTVIHGRYGDLGTDVAECIPLEYLALLHPAAEAAAAIRELESRDGDGNATGIGTLLVYGASTAAGIASVQLGTAVGMSVVAVVSGEHGAGNIELLDTIKGLTSYPGTAVPEEVALVKNKLYELTKSIAEGDEEPVNTDTHAWLEEFKANVLDYAAAFPSNKPSVIPSNLNNQLKIKDREYFTENMTAYLEQFPRGSPSMTLDELETFNLEKFQLFRSKFNPKTASKLTPGEEQYEFNPAEVCKSLIHKPEPLSEYLKYQDPVSDGGGEFVPYELSMLQPQFADPMDDNPLAEIGGPVLGAVIVATPTLVRVMGALEQAGPKLRDRAEALQFLTNTERDAYAAASSVAAVARRAGKKIMVVGGSDLPGLESATVTPVDIKAALTAMDIDEDDELAENSKLNFFCQVYRAGDWPVYADYAIHRATEMLAGPRQIVVTK
mmetsp:Transcript_8679/g.10945  ORF Transcript_8679/g.10945 Transcript_8679/m.10945 type:complete len:549 (+) Transcript_8679:71-1717(+)